MKKLGLALMTAVAFCMTVAAPALAEYPPKVQGAGGGAGGEAGGPTAFTGANITVGAALLAVLVVAGVAALLVSRRKATATK